MNLSYILKDARKSREDNRMYFYSLILVFIVSYTVLSFDKSTISSFLYVENIFSIQDYLVESFSASIIFLLTLIFFASKNQIEVRKEEFAILMMMGEKRSKISRRMAIESIINSVYALIIAFPIALFLNEFINLFVIKILELGLRSHDLRISFTALFTSMLVVIILQIVSIKLISFFILRKEPYKLIKGKIKDDYPKEKKLNEKKSLHIALILFLAYIIPFMITGVVITMTAILFLVSLFFFYRGFTYLLDKLSEKSISKLFEIRLIEEKFKNEYKSLFFINVLMVVSFIILFTPLNESFSLNSYNYEQPDFTIYDKKESVEKMYAKEKYNKILEEPMPFYMTDTREKFNDNIYLVSNDEYVDLYYEFSSITNQSSVNKILEWQGEEPIDLNDNESILILQRNYWDNSDINKAGDLYSEFLGKKFYVVEKIDMNNFFSNDEVFNDNTIVINDKMYEEFIGNDDPFAYNFYIKESFKNEEGIIKASDIIRDMMIEDGLIYESKIWQLKNDISSFLIDLYTNLYFGLLLFIIANTYIAFKFIYWVKENRERFEIKRLLGADRVDNRKKMVNIINYYFIFLYSISFLANYIYYNYSVGNVHNTLVSDSLFVYINIGLAIFEIIYIGIIKKIARKELEKSR